MRTDDDGFGPARQPSLSVPASGTIKTIGPTARSGMAVRERDTEEWVDAQADDEPFMEGWERPSVGFAARTKKGVLSLFGVADSVGQAMGESWPLVVIGLLGGALFVGGMTVLILGW